ncbi:Periplasmic serine endoprotease DegP precursor [Raoultella planticola]|nr:Periplasmic serine endoprotease DegP precursor [Raoultella planticola]
MKKTTLAMSALALSLGLALSPLSASAAETSSSASSTQQMPSLAPMLEKVMPSVVSINVEGSTTVNTPRMPRNFQQFFGDNSPFCQDGSPFQSSPFCQGGGQGGGAPGDGGQQQKFMALGSGVIIDAAKGYVVTNNHVVDNATTIKVQLSDGRKFDAKVVGKDPRSDIALIQIQDPKNLTAIKLADSDALRVGDYTVAIGNPFGLGETVTSGIVSALGRSGLNVENYENFIQTDAAINRGNSGGALVNLNGELIGINTAILAPDGGNIGIGFAIPSNMVKNLTEQMVKYGQVKRGRAGYYGDRAEL